jgi:hypothetical protein
VLHLLPMARVALAAELDAKSRSVFEFPDATSLPLGKPDHRKGDASQDVLLKSASTGERSVATQVLELCAALLRDHYPGCQQALHSGFLAVLRVELAAHLRRQQLPELDGETGTSDAGLVPAVLALASAAATLPELKLEVWRTLVCWVPLYAHTAGSVQQQLLHHLRRISLAQPTLFRVEVGVGFLVDALKMWYTMVCAPSGVCSSRSDSHGGFDVLSESKIHAAAAAAAAAVDAGRGTDSNRLSPALTFAVRHELLREFLRFIGCAMLASPAVLQPSEVQASGGGAAALRRQGSSPPVERLRRRDVEPLLHLLNTDVDSVPRAIGAGGLPPPLELLRAEACLLLAAFLDYESSHVVGSPADAILQHDGVEQKSNASGNDVSAAASARSEPTISGGLGISMLVGQACSTGQILPLLDLPARGSLAAMLLFGVMPQVC